MSALRTLPDRADQHAAADERGEVAKAGVVEGVEPLTQEAEQ